ncbi:cation:proton antiporter [Methylomonas sp. SURF-2]|uniref:Cation:proton antiporter n=1 Tax=Methylomonas subterranea TaxID=2952225 RepID=A0ABT1TKU4_9GAMM|nr:cation:proton antiporter [Methylomonas sp. SURF-2]MCQ8106080.1 cation:proton antiporter [Methylomonas sp. SURF-2]
MKISWSCILLALLPLDTALAASVDGSNPFDARSFLFIALLLIGAKICSLIEKIGQPSIMGELLLGLLLGNLPLLGIEFFEAAKTDPNIQFFAELGVVILLFQIGLESHIGDMIKVGPRALLVALIGVNVPFVLGAFVAGPLLMPGLASHVYLMIGGALTATSVAIAASLFRDMKMLDSLEARIILGAAVFDDVLALIAFSIVMALGTVGGISGGEIGQIFAESFLFLFGAVFVGHYAAAPIGRGLSKINSGVGMKFGLAVTFCLTFAYLAHRAGLSPIIGAFAAGLVLDKVHFRFFHDPEIVNDLKACVRDETGPVKANILNVVEQHAEKHVEDLMNPLYHFFTPLFFVLTGMSVRLDTLFDSQTLLTALVLTAVAVVGKLVSGLGAGRADKMIVGLGMVPRGEVGLVFAMTGFTAGILPDQVFSVIVLMVILTTLMTPPLLAIMLRKHAR